MERTQRNRRIADALAAFHRDLSILDEEDQYRILLWSIGRYVRLTADRVRMDATEEARMDREASAR